MTDAEADYLRRCRMGLYADATANREHMSALDWEDLAASTEAGKAVGARTLDALVRLVWRI